MYKIYFREYDTDGNRHIDQVRKFTKVNNGDVIGSNNEDASGTGGKELPPAPSASPPPPAQTPLSAAQSPGTPQLPPVLPTAVQTATDVEERKSCGLLLIVKGVMW